MENKVGRELLRLRGVPAGALLIMALLLLTLSPVLCQDESHLFRLAVEEMLALDDEADPALLLEELEELKEFPVRINTGDEQEISRLFFLNAFQVMVLADHIRRNGPVETIYELALLPGFDRQTAMLMAHCITLTHDRGSAGRSYSRTAAALSFTTRFTGGEEEWEGGRSLLKVKHEQQRFGFGLTAENDPGERFSFNGAPGADFLSGYVEYRGSGVIKEVIAGDYRIRTGEGVLFNSGRWMGSWLSSPSFLAGAAGAAPYRSTEENDFFRGVSIMAGGTGAKALLFVSSKRIDARLKSDDESNVIGVSNLVRGGLHVTPSQLEARRSLTEQVAGLHLSASGEWVTAGVTAAATWFSLPFLPDMRKPENLHAFTGDRLYNLAFDIRAGTGPILFFGEAAVSHDGRPAERGDGGIVGTAGSSDNAGTAGTAGTSGAAGTAGTVCAADIAGAMGDAGTSGAEPSMSGAGLNGLLHSLAATAGLRLKPSPRVTSNILVRWYPPGYHAFHSGASKSVSGPGNEAGIAASLHLEAARHLFITAAADHYRVPWARYRSAAPACGSRQEIRAEYLPRDDISFRLSWSASSREYDSQEARGTATGRRHTRRQAGVVLDIEPLSGLRLTTRASVSLVTPAAERGGMLCQDLSYTLPAVPLRVWLRYAACSTGGWESRLYAWENDLVSAFSVPALYGEMTRSFVMVSWKIAGGAEARVKYAFTAAQRSEGDLLRQELRGQLRVTF